MPLPSVTSGLQWWFDARDITGVTTGSTISSWNDSSGNGHTASVSTGTATYQTNQYNSGAALALSSCRLDISGSITETGVHTLFAVYKLSVTTSGDQTIAGQNGTNGIAYSAAHTQGGAVRLQYIFNDFIGIVGAGTAAPDTSWHQSIGWQNSSSSLG